VNSGLADYTPIFLSAVPELFWTGGFRSICTHPDITSDAHGYLSLGISVDIVKAAVDSASLVIAQMNAQMPRVHGETFVHINEIDYLVHHDEPLLEYRAVVSDEITEKIGKYVARVIRDGDAIQVGYAVYECDPFPLHRKKNLGCIRSCSLTASWNS